MGDRVRRILEDLRSSRGFMDCVCGWEVLPASEGRFAAMPEDLHPVLRSALSRKGVERLYVHQELSYRDARAGRDAVVVTPTASGKSLCYGLPVLQTLLEAEEKRALYVFPTKALSQDQQADLNESVLGGSLPIKVATYDGDTPASVRMSARETGQIVITNPDMLHSGILPNHTKWVKFFKCLAFIVIDELHIYRGVFGSHMANVLRRLLRVAAFYGSCPVILCTSATIGNPLELAERITGRSMRLIDDNGAPRGEKHLIMYNPPLVDAVQGIRRGVVLESRRLALDFLRAGIKTIVFTRSRIQAELIASYINSALANPYTGNEGIRVESYRGGYLPSERRAVEAGLREGSITGVVSTNALELGIDIGGLDAAILAGFPPSISSAWQQAGRAGRRLGTSLAIMIASSSPTDQFMVRHPAYFLATSPESGFVDPDNPYILMDHLKCAVFEIPLGDGEAFAPDCVSLLEIMQEEGTVRHAGGAWYWADRSYPSEGISLRSASSENIVIVDATGGRNSVIGEMDRPSAKEMLFPNAVYLHRGSQFVVKELDLRERRATVEEAEVNYYTDAIVKRDIKVLHEDETASVAGARFVLADILVRSQVAKFKKIRFHSHENIGYGDISLPEEEMHTRALVLLFPSGTACGSRLHGLSEGGRMQAVVGLAYLVRNIAPIFLLCDQRDLGVAERVRDPHFDLPGVYFFDMYPGGTGLAEKLRHRIADILSASLAVLNDCVCGGGCPSCVGPRDAETDIGGDPKLAVRALLEAAAGEAGGSP